MLQWSKVKRFTPWARAVTGAGKEKREVLSTVSLGSMLLMDEVAPTVSSVLTSTGDVFTNFFTWLGTITTTIISNPLLFIFLVGVPILGIVTGWTLRLIRRGKK